MADTPKKINLDGLEYEISCLSESGQAQLLILDFLLDRMKELKGNLALLQCAKNSYVGSLKKEIVSSKAGVLFGDD